MSHDQIRANVVKRMNDQLLQYQNNVLSNLQSRVSHLQEIERQLYQTNDEAEMLNGDSLASFSNCIDEMNSAIQYSECLLIGQGSVSCQATGQYAPVKEFPSSAPTISLTTPPSNSEQNEPELIYCGY